MPQKTSEVLLRYKVDTQTAQQVSDTAQRLKQELTAVANETAVATDVLIQKYVRLAQVEGNVVSQSQALQKELKGIGASSDLIALATNDFDNLTDSIRRAEEQTRGLQEQFDRTSRGVALAGDVQSNLGAIGGIVGTLGFGTGSQAVGVAGEVVVLAEELPRLKTALAGLPSVITNAVTALGPVGLGFTAVIAAVGIAAALSAQAAKRQEEATYRLLDAQREAAEFAARSTTTDVQARIDEIELQNELIREQRTTILRELERARDAVGGFDRNVQDFLGNLELFSGPIGSVGDLNDRLRDLQDEAEGNNEEIEQLTRQLDSNRVAANDAAEAARLLAEEEQRLAEIRTQDILASASQQAQALRQIIDLNQLDAEGLRDRRDALLDESTVLGAELNALRASGEISEDVTNRINDLTQSLIANGEAVSRIDDLLLPSAEAQEALARAEEERLAVEESLIEAQASYNADLQSIYEERAQLERDHQDRLIDIARKAAEAQEDALAKLIDKQRDLQTSLSSDFSGQQQEFTADELEAQINAQRDERDAYRDHLRRLEDIRNRAQDQEFEAILNRDFRSLFLQRRGQTRDINAENRQFEEGRQDAVQALNDQADDRQRAFIQERAQRLAQYQQQLIDANAQYQQERAQIDQRRAEALAQERQRLTDERDAIQRELDLRRQGYQQELELAAQGSQARVRLEQQTQQALLSQAQATLAQLAGGVGAGFNFNGGSTYNNRQTNLGGQIFQIQGSSPQQTAQQIYQIINGLLD